MAREMGAEVVELDMSIPFSAARARTRDSNGSSSRRTRRSSSSSTATAKSSPGWIDARTAALNERPELAVVCGRRRERFPDKTIYNKLADIEWDTPIGDAKSLRRRRDDPRRGVSSRSAATTPPSSPARSPRCACAFASAAGRSARLDAEMTLHDAAMTRFGQWWKRIVRGGHAYAEGAVDARPPAGAALGEGSTRDHGLGNDHSRR